MNKWSITGSLQTVQKFNSSQSFSLRSLRFSTNGTSSSLYLVPFSLCFSILGISSRKTCLSLVVVEEAKKKLSKFYLFCQNKFILMPLPLVLVFLLQQVRKCLCVHSRCLQPWKNLVPLCQREQCHPQMHFSYISKPNQSPMSLNFVNVGLSYVHGALTTTLNIVLMLLISNCKVRY